MLNVRQNYFNYVRSLFMNKKTYSDNYLIFSVNSKTPKFKILDLIDTGRLSAPEPCSPESSKEAAPRAKGAKAKRKATAKR